MEAAAAPQRGPRARGPLRARADRRPPAHGALRRAELQPSRARAARHRQEPPVPADLPLLPPRLRRQGDGGEDVREQRQRTAGARLPVRRSVLRRDLGRLLRPEGRGEHPQGLHGVRRVLARQGEHPGRGRRRHGGQPRCGRRAPAAGRASAESALRGHARRHRVHGPHPRLPARLGLPEAQPERALHRSFRPGQRFPVGVLEPAPYRQPGAGAPGPGALRGRAQRPGPHQRSTRR